MKIIIIGGTGLIGQAVKQELDPRHDIVIAGHSSGDIQVDITSKESIENLFQSISSVDAIVSTTGRVSFVGLDDMDDNAMRLGIEHKMMGQINLAMAARQYLNDSGSITLTSGVLNCDPIYMGASAAMVNGAIDGFVKAAAIDMPRGIRINVVSPTVIEEAMVNYAPYFRGHVPVKASTAALAYSKSVEGRLTGEIIKAGY